MEKYFIVINCHIYICYYLFYENKNINIFDKYIFLLVDLMCIIYMDFLKYKFILFYIYCQL